MAALGVHVTYGTSRTSFRSVKRQGTHRIPLTYQTTKS